MKAIHMTSRLRLATAILPLAGMTIAAAPPQDGPIDTLPQGHYECALPGDASGKAWNRKPELDFTIGNSSSYRTAKGAGTYLLRGKWLTFTRGPLKGKKFQRMGASVLRIRDAHGGLGDLRCVRVSA